MKRLFKAAIRGLSHTRVVKSGSPPLYRMMIIGSIISAVVQISTGQSSKSLQENAFPWFQYTFMAVQLVASIAVIASLYMIDGSKYDAKKLHCSLTIEFIGLILVQTSILVNVVAAGLYNSGAPPGQSTWFSIMFLIWSITRFREIRKAIGELTRHE